MPSQINCYQRNFFSSMTLKRKLLIGGAALTVGVGLEVLKRQSCVYKLDKLIHHHLEVGSGNCDIHIVNNPAEWHQVYPLLTRDLATLPLLGVDCEWVTRAHHVSPVSLLQLATVSGLCVLVRLCHMNTIPQSLRALLASSEVYKLGVAICDDKQKLLADYALDVNGCVDIRHLVVKHWQGEHQGKLGLQSLAFLLLDVKLDKDWRIRASDWSAETLSERQVTYAANDALVAINMTWVILKSSLTRSATSIVSSIFWSHQRTVLQVTDILDLYCDLKFTNSQAKAAAKEGKGGRKEKSGSPLKKIYQNSTRKNPLYHNCLLQAPDGQVLCTMDVKKAEWYVTKDLGVKVCEEPLTVRLKFEPSGRPSGKCGEYYTSAKPNLCVVCGEEESFLRKSIVPHEYRKYFPTVMKDHQSHDVLLMCVACHQRSNSYDSEVRKSLAELCNAPIGTEEDVKVRANFDLKKVKSAGRALISNIKSDQKIPDWRIKELENTLKAHFKVDTLTEDIIEKAANCNFNEANESYVPHSRAVVQHFLERGGLLEFEIMWRKHFLDKMKPQFLPDLWSVNHQEERLGVKAAENRIDLDQYRIATEGSSDLDLEAYRNIKGVQLGVNPQL